MVDNLQILHFTTKPPHTSQANVQGLFLSLKKSSIGGKQYLDYL